MPLPNFVAGLAWLGLAAMITANGRAHASPGATVPYQHGVTAVNQAYIGGVYSPMQDRVYLVPYHQAPQATWHYIDGATGDVVSYRHGVTAVNGAYQGGAYSPSLDRVYLVPYLQAPQATWHYIDGATGDVVSYQHGVTAFNGAYRGGAYSPSLDRVYLVPYIQAARATWHYIDGATGDVVGYQHGVTAVNQACVGGAYSPSLDRVYLVPSGQAPQATWHYIDGATGVVVGYQHGVTAVNYAYQGGAYSPSLDRVYLVPHNQASQATWHYIDGATGDVVGYQHGVTAFNEAYNGGAYSPSLDRVYLAPYYQAPQATWHYIDGATGDVVSYRHGVTAVPAAYDGGAYSPTLDRLYLVPLNQADEATWHYIEGTRTARPTTASPTARPTTSVPTASPTSSPTSSDPTGSPTCSQVDTFDLVRCEQGREIGSCELNAIFRSACLFTCIGCTESPTASPTSPSTSEPTLSPSTSEPTLSPSTSPTGSPTCTDNNTTACQFLTLNGGCANLNTRFMCRGSCNSCATEAPTGSPTISPTTSDPTVSPSASPTTADPTTSPSISPTTSDPTASPTVSPTASDPTTSPTTSPTSSDPTTSPTVSPTTATPTASPSVSPTSGPTVSPTFSPAVTGAMPVIAVEFRGSASSLSPAELVAVERGLLNRLEQALQGLEGGRTAATLERSSIVVEVASLAAPFSLEAFFGPGSGAGIAELHAIVRSIQSEGTPFVAPVGGSGGVFLIDGISSRHGIASPTLSPSGSPTSADPTTSPTDAPTTSDPTASPTGSTTTSDPTVSPTITTATPQPKTTASSDSSDITIRAALLGCIALLAIVVCMLVAQRRRLRRGGRGGTELETESKAAQAPTPAGNGRGTAATTDGPGDGPRPDPTVSTHVGTVRLDAHDPVRPHPRSTSTVSAAGGGEAPGPVVPRSLTFAEEDGPLLMHDEAPAAAGPHAPPLTLRRHAPSSEPSVSAPSASHWNHALDLVASLSTTGSRDVPTERGAWVNYDPGRSQGRGDGGLYFTADGTKSWSHDEVYAQNPVLTDAVGTRDAPTFHIFDCIQGTVGKRGESGEATGERQARYGRNEAQRSLDAIYSAHAAQNATDSADGTSAPGTPGRKVGAGAEDETGTAKNSTVSRDRPAKTGQAFVNFDEGRSQGQGNGGLYYTAAGPNCGSHEEVYAQNPVLVAAVGPKDRPTCHIFDCIQGKGGEEDDEDGAGPTGERQARYGRNEAQRRLEAIYDIRNQKTASRAQASASASTAESKCIGAGAKEVSVDHMSGVAFEAHDEETAQPPPYSLGPLPRQRSSSYSAATDFSVVAGSVEDVVYEDVRSESSDYNLPTTNVANVANVANPAVRPLASSSEPQYAAVDCSGVAMDDYLNPKCLIATPVAEPSVPAPRLPASGSEPQHAAAATRTVSDYELPTTSAASVANPAARHLASGSEPQYAAVDYSGVAMDDGCNYANPQYLAPTPVAGAEPSVPAIYEYDYAEMRVAGRDGVSDEPLYDDLSAKDNDGLYGSTGGSNDGEAAAQTFHTGTLEREM